MNSETANTELDLEVRGMACEGCAETVAKAAKAVPGVTEALVDLKVGSIRLTGDAGVMDKGRVAEAVRAAGYTVF